MLDGMFLRWPAGAPWGGPVTVPYGAASELKRAEPAKATMQNDVRVITPYP